MYPTWILPSFSQRATYYKDIQFYHIIVSNPIQSSKIPPLCCILDTNLSTKTITRTSNLLGSQLLDIVECRLNHGFDLRRLMILQPRGQVHIPSMDKGVTAEVIRENGQVAVCGEVVGEELAVVVDPKDVGEEEDGSLGAFVFGV